jgi:hypothetical protein
MGAKSSPNETYMKQTHNALFLFICSLFKIADWAYRVEWENDSE